jgi:hypothetical protein
MTCELNGDHGNAVATVDGTVHVCVECAFTSRDAGFTVEPWAQYFES